MRKLILITLLAAGVSPGFAAQKSAPPIKGGHTLVCWNDENGVRSCGDRVPPQYAQDEREVLNSRGIVTTTKARKLTEAEAAKAEEAAAAAALEKRRLNLQIGYDKYLLQTFQSVAQMQTVRDNRVATLEGRINLAEKSVAENEKTLQSLRDRVAKKPNDAKLKKQLKEFETSLVDTLKAVAQMKKDREETNLKFDRDVSRYKKLRSGELQMGQADAATEVKPEAEEAAEQQ